MNQELFRHMIENQLIWRQAYNKNKKRQHAINVIKNSKYASRGNRKVEEIDKLLNNL